MRGAAFLFGSLACVSLGDARKSEHLEALESVLLAMHPVTPMSRRQTGRSLSPQMIDRRQVTTAGAAAALGAWLSLALPDAAEAARTGGRAGGRAPARSRSAPAPAPSTYAPRTTNVYVAPTVGVAPVSPFGYGYGGYGMGYGGYGYGGGVSTGAFLGIELVETYFREQRRQQYLQEQLRIQQQLGQDQAQITQLQNQLAQQNAKIAGMQKDNPDLQKQSAEQLQQQLDAQKKEIEQLKAR